MLEKHYFAIYPEMAIEKKRKKRIHSQLCSENPGNPSDNHILKKVRQYDLILDNKKIESTHLSNEHNFKSSELEYKRHMEGLFMLQEADSSYYVNKHKSTDGTEFCIPEYKQKEENYFQKSMGFFASVCNGINLSSEYDDC